jgi:hypothetical protein
MTEVNADGSDVQTMLPEIFNEVNTNYKLWEMFGGMHS